jgi:hypothetical protein
VRQEEDVTRINAEIQKCYRDQHSQVAQAQAQNDQCMVQMKADAATIEEMKQTEKELRVGAFRGQQEVDVAQSECRRIEGELEEARRIATAAAQEASKATDLMASAVAMGRAEGHERVQKQAQEVALAESQRDQGK